MIRFFLNHEGNTISRSVAGWEKGCRSSCCSGPCGGIVEELSLPYEWLKALNTAVQRGLYGHTIEEVKRPYYCLRAHSQTGMDILTSTLRQLRKNQIKCKYFLFCPL